MRVLYIDIDSLRADHLGCYGYDRATSPTIDSLAEDGVAFEECFASDAPCLPSRTALATCRYGMKNGAVTHYGPGQWYSEMGSGHTHDPDRPLSFEHLSERGGVRTASVSSFSKRHMAYHFGGAFDETLQPSNHTGAELGPEVTETATDWLETNAESEDWFLHVNYWDVHHPYEGIEEFVDLVVESGDRPEWPDQATIDAQQDSTGTRTAAMWPSWSEIESGRYNSGRYGEWPFPDQITERADFEHLVDGYDAAIRAVDHEISRLLSFLEEKGVREETAVIISADHGEAMGEHAIYTEHAFPHPACQRVPMIVSWPGITDEAAGATVPEKIYQFDLMATLCDLADAPVPDGWDAEPFTSALRSEAFEGRDYVVSGQGIMTYGRAVYRGDWIYVALYHPGVQSCPGLYNHPDAPGDGLELLHHRGEDPTMTENLVDERPEVAAEMRSLLTGWVHENLQTGDCQGEDPLVRMASTWGPYNYQEPVALRDVYRDRGRSQEQIDRMADSLYSRPFIGDDYLVEIDPTARPRREGDR
jgi:arylsulfatase A-like enzyme